MPYVAALTKAWDELIKLSPSSHTAVALLNDTYEIDLKNKSIISNSSGAPTKDYLTILLLHYLIGHFKNNYSPGGEWVSLREVEGGESYYPVFHNSVIEPVLRKYGETPENLWKVLEHLGGRRIQEGDIAIELVTFADVLVRIILWKADAEFGPEATILFDRNLKKVYSMEDIVVFLHFIISRL